MRKLNGALLVLAIAVTLVGLIQLNTQPAYASLGWCSNVCTSCEMAGVCNFDGDTPCCLAWDPKHIVCTQYMVTGQYTNCENYCLCPKTVIVW